MSEYAVELEEVSKHFGPVVAVDGISLPIRDGEFFSLLGPSGCGKTTTLRLIAGFELPTAGEVYIGGELQGETPPYRRPVNTVFQNYALFLHNECLSERRLRAPDAKGPKGRDPATCSAPTAALIGEIGLIETLILASVR